MGSNFTKVLTMESVWKENLRLPILWENYGNKVNSHTLPIAIGISTTALYYGIDSMP